MDKIRQKLTKKKKKEEEHGYSVVDFEMCLYKEYVRVIVPLCYG